MIRWVLEREEEPGLAVDEGAASNVGDAVFAARDAWRTWRGVAKNGLRIHWKIRIHDGRRELAVMGA